MTNEQNTQPTEPVEQVEQVTAEPHGSAETAAEPQVDWKAEARKWEQRAKENKGAADELAKLREANMSEQEKAAKRAETAEAQLREAQRKLSVYEAAKTAGIDASLLERMKGDTPEEIAANAEALKAAFGGMSKFPEVTDNGASAPTTKQRAEIPQMI